MPLKKVYIISFLVLTLYKLCVKIIPKTGETHEEGGLSNEEDH